MSYKIYKVPHNFGATVAYTYEVRSANRPAPLNSKAVRWNIKSHESAKQVLKRMTLKYPEWEFMHKSQPLGEPEPITEVYYVETQTDYIAVKSFLSRTRLAPVLKHDDVSDDLRKRGTMSMGFCRIMKFNDIVGDFIEKAIA